MSLGTHAARWFATPVAPIDLSRHGGEAPMRTVCPGWCERCALADCLAALGAGLRAIGEAWEARARVSSPTAASAEPSQPDPRSLIPGGVATVADFFNTGRSPRAG